MNPRDLIEPAARNLGRDVTSGGASRVKSNVVEDWESLASIAISLKRIADSITITSPIDDRIEGVGHE